MSRRLLRFHRCPQSFPRLVIAGADFVIADEARKLLLRACKNLSGHFESHWFLLYMRIYD